jgi:hypothetical protein
VELSGHGMHRTADRHVTGKGEWVARASGGEGPAVPGGVAGAGMAGAGSALASTSPLVSVVGGGLCLCIGLEGGGDTDACD